MTNHPRTKHFIAKRASSVVVSWFVSIHSVEPSDCPGVDSVVDRLQQIWAHVVDKLVLSEEEAQRFANRRRCVGSRLRFGDLVWLSSRHVPMKVSSPKFKPRFIGPYRISEIINPVSFRLALPASFAIHNVFHRSLLRKYVEPVVPSADPPAPVLVDGELEYVVEKILDSRFSRRKLQYLVKWKGYGQEDNSWVFASDVHAADLVRAFHLARPDRPGGPDLRPDIKATTKRKPNRNLRARRAASSEEEEEHEKVERPKRAGGRGLTCGTKRRQKAAEEPDSDGQRSPGEDDTVPAAPEPEPLSSRTAGPHSALSFSEEKEGEDVSFKIKKPTVNSVIFRVQKKADAEHRSDPQERVPEKTVLEISMSVYFECTTGATHVATVCRISTTWTAAGKQRYSKRCSPVRRTEHGSHYSLRLCQRSVRAEENDVQTMTAGANGSSESEQSDKENVDLSEMEEYSSPAGSSPASSPAHHTLATGVIDILFSTDEIPDAAKIRAARTRRRLARARGDYMALDVSRERSDSSRSEGDSELDDHEKRIQFAPGVKTLKEQMAEEASSGSESDSDDEEEDDIQAKWEEQQIRKAIRRPQTLSSDLLHGQSPPRVKKHVEPKFSTPLVTMEDVRKRLAAR
ncbi:unnamed protein product [Ranitomeya imitator]|uniref:Chromo domain-containing protein n=1 Tax=Ranitomeya imitator TaxID=111125 RepID=A0ABN9MP08_9NEOB|nr:unnamed protein product [Ranitomeya imitator]